MEPAFCLSIWQERLQGTGAGELGSPGAKAPACLPRQKSCPTAKAGHLAAPQEQGTQAAGRLWEQGSAELPEPRAKEREAERDTRRPPTHSGGCHGVGQPLSLAAGKQPGWHGDRMHLALPRQACWDFSPQNLSGGKWFCPRISYPLCDFPKPWHLEEKFMKRQ